MTLVETNKNTPSNTRGPFDYSQLPANLASEARWRAKQINASKERHVLEVGLELIKMKEKLAHGQFVEWIDRELNFTPATARNYMRVAKEFASRPKTVFVLPPATLYRLAGAAPEVRDEIVARVEAGEHIDRNEVENAIRRSKATAVEATDERSDTTSRQEAAARELIGRLSKHLTNDEILKIHTLWCEAGSRALRDALDGAPRKESTDAN